MHIFLSSRDGSKSAQNDNVSVVNAWRYESLIILLASAWFWAGTTFSTFAATQLNLVHTNGQIHLSWQGDGFILQSAPNLTSPLTWSPAGLPVTDIGTNHFTVTQPSNSAAFYRLIVAGGPKGLVVAPADTSFFLDWDSVPGADSYNVYLASAPGLTPTNYLSLPGGQKFSNVTPPYFIVGLTNGVKYYIVVTAKTGPAESPPSAEASAVFGPHAEVSGSVVMNVVTGVGQTNWVSIPGAQVWLVNTTNGVATAAVRTDLGGKFSIPEQPAGTYTICYTVSNTPAGCGTVCSPQPIVILSEPVAVSALVYTSACTVVYGRVTLDGNGAFQERDSFFGLNVQALVRLVSGGQTNTAPVNQSGEFLFLGALPGSYLFTVDCEGAHVQQNITLPAAGPITFALPNRPPVIENAQTLDLATGQEIFRAPPGTTIRLVVEAVDADGDPLTYTWIPGLGSTTFQPTNSPSVLWQLPTASGMHTMYYMVRDNRGGVAPGKLVIFTDPGVLFTGTVVQNGGPPTNTATITINGQSTTADASGYFGLNLTNLTPPFVMTIQAPGSTPLSQTFYEAAVGGVYVMPQSYQDVFYSSAPVIFRGTTTLSFPTGSVVDSTNQTYFGPVIITWSIIDPALPGSGLPGLLGSANVFLTPFIGVNVALHTTTGAPLYINPYHSAPAFVSTQFGTITPPINTPLPVWRFNSTNGQFTASTNLATVSGNYVAFPILQTGITLCAFSNSQSTCLTLEMSPNLNLPVDVIVSSPAAQVKTITKRFTTFTGFPPNQLVTFKIFEANEILLTNSCVISNAVTVGPAGPNCVTLKLAFPSAREPKELLDFRPEGGTTNYGNDYYNIIDPTGAKRTFADWKAANGFNAGVDAEAIYFNNGDLGFGRWMGMKTNANGDIAYFVSNYGSPDAAIAARAGNQTDGLGATVCMEYSKHPGTNANARYTKFYIYDELNRRQSGVELDGRGYKFVPHLCIVCHGGKQPASDAAGDGGDVKSKFLPFDLESFKYSQNPNFTLAAQSAAFKVLNAVTLRAASTPTITNLVEGWYGGLGLPGNYNKDFIPPGWTNNLAERDLYNKVVKVSCRSCHISRNNNLSFGSYANLLTYTNRGKLDDVICDSANMPNALRTFNIFWSSMCSPVSQPYILKTNFNLKCP